MLKKVCSFVLASLKGSTYGGEYASPSRSAAALLEDLFEHPVDHSHSGYDVHAIESDRVSEWLFNSLLDPFQ